MPGGGRVPSLPCPRFPRWPPSGGRWLFYPLGSSPHLTPWLQLTRPLRLPTVLVQQLSIPTYAQAKAIRGS